MKYPHARLLVFSKVPEPGQVKTRLIPLLGAEAAARLYSDLLEDTLRKSVAGGLCPVELWCAPSDRHAFFRRCAERYPLRLYRQGEGDIGRRMSVAIRTALQGATHAVLIGADCPALSAADIDTAIAQLAGGTDIVLGPAMDGGYYLIGMSHHHPQLFDAIAWGTPRVLEATLERCRDNGLAWFCLPEYIDVDTPEDYLQYRAGRPSR